MTTRLLITAGEPAGIGPDLLVELAQRSTPHALVAIASPDQLQQRARQLRLPLQLHLIDAQSGPEATAATLPPGHLYVIPQQLGNPSVCGTLDTNNAQAVLWSLDTASRLCVEGRFDALVTGPVHKGIINDAGYAFTGHTEYLAAKTGGNHPVMMLQTPGLRVALVTTHLPLSAVSAAITGERLTTVLSVMHGDLINRFGIARPRLIVCGLNPHAGESGHLGREEIDIIAPALARLREQGMDLVGPTPADTAFTTDSLANADAVLAMYHDQGLPVIKKEGFGRTVNITLGLPIIRTSVDHGTALDLAGSGRADCSSLLYAIETAVALVHAGGPATLSSSNEHPVSA